MFRFSLARIAMRRYPNRIRIFCSVFLLLLSCVCRLPSASADVSATYELGPAVLNGQTYVLDIALEVAATLNEETVFFAVDVSESDDALTENGTDYSRFSFELDPALVDWDQIPGTGFGSGTLQQAVEFDTITAPREAGRYQLGRLSFDAQGLDPSVFPATLSVEAAGSTIGAQLPNSPPSFDFVPLAFSPGTVVILIPEPASSLRYGLVVSLLFAAVQRRNRKRQLSEGFC